jgi:phosphoribosylformylglycinamidine synthase
MMQSVIEFAGHGGRVLGICNGFQILCESGLLPGALLSNLNMQFVCRNVHIKGEDGKVLKVPIAHGEGRYHADAKTLDHLEKNGQIIYRYCDVDGGVTEQSNPNGALKNIAGICNDKRTVFGMMPHPERASNRLLGNLDGREVFKHITGL